MSNEHEQEHELVGMAVPSAEVPAGNVTFESAPDRRKSRVELLGAIIIGVAAVLTAIATYQGSQVDGTVQTKSTEAVSLMLASNDIYNLADAEGAEERDWFFTFLTAEASGDFNTSDVFFRTMPAEVQVLTEDWLTVNEEALDDPTMGIDDPFFVDENEMPALASFSQLFSTSLEMEGNRLQDLAACALFDSQVAEIRGDNYGLSTVFLAIALVVGGIAALLKGRGAQIIVLVTSVVSLLLGGAVLGLAGDQAEARQDASIEFFLASDGTRQLAGDALEEADSMCPETS